MEGKLLICNPVLAGDLYIHGLCVFHICIKILNIIMIIFNKLSLIFIWRPFWITLGGLHGDYSLLLTSWDVYEWKT